MNDTQITLTGWIGGDVTLREVAGGRAVASFRLACTPTRYRAPSKTRHVPFVDQPEPDQRQPRLVLVDHRGLPQHHRREPPGRDDRHVLGVVGQFADHAAHHAVDLPGGDTATTSGTSSSS